MQAVVSSYNATATSEAEDLEMMNMMEIDEAPIESVQLVLCQAFHGVRRTTFISGSLRCLPLSAELETLMRSLRKYSLL